MRVRSVTFAATGLLTLAYCCWLARPSHPSFEVSAADDRIITKLDARWAAAWATKDVPAIIEYYAENTSVRIPDWWSRGLAKPGPDASRWFPTIGKRNVREELTDLMHDSNLTITVSAGHAAGSLAVTFGEYSLKRLDTKTGLPSPYYLGRYTTWYDKGPDGAWRISQQSFRGGNSGPADPLPPDPNLSRRRLKTNDITTFLAPHRSSLNISKSG